LIAGLTSDPGLITAVGVLAASLTTGCLIPQVLRTHRTKSAGDLSLIYLAAMDAGVILWVVYGVFLDSTPIIVANVASALLVSDLLVLRLRQRPPSSEARPERPRAAEEHAGSPTSPAERDAA